MLLDIPQVPLSPNAYWLLFFFGKWEAREIIVSLPHISAAHFFKNRLCHFVFLPFIFIISKAFFTLLGQCFLCRNRLIKNAFFPAFLNLSRIPSIKFFWPFAAQSFTPQGTVCTFPSAPAAQFLTWKSHFAATIFWRDKISVFLSQPLRFRLRRIAALCQRSQLFRSHQPIRYICP